MTEKIEHRTCEDCGEEKRTTVSFLEEPIYYCEECKKKTAMIAYRKSTTMKGLIVAIIIFVTGMVVEWALLKFMF